MVQLKNSLCAVLALFLVASATAKDRAECEREYKPKFGQAGKDVAWEPTSTLLAADMLKMAKTTARDRVYDLGAGDGAIVIVAAKEFGATAVGIEYNPDLAKLGQCFVEAAGVADNAKVVEGDIFKTDFSSATVVTLFLVPELNLRLRPTLLKMPPGTRVVSHMHKMYEWQWDDEVERDGERARLWIVPASVQGSWTFKQSGGPTQNNNPDSFTLVLNQEFQMLSGNLQVAAERSKISGKMLGADIALDLAARGKLTGKVEKGRIVATVADGAGKKEYVGVESRATKGR
jgi:hypothetical protein